MAKPDADVPTQVVEVPARPSGEQGSVPDLALALRYEAIEAMPRIVARGAGKLAQAIVALAEEHDVPVHKDGAMVELLRSMDAGQVLPTETRAIVSEVLCFLYHLETLHAGTEANKIPAGPKADS